ncbi:MAG: hypothetical protein WBO44_09495, partial [Saprospiraceae bacterium]
MRKGILPLLIIWNFYTSFGQNIFAYCQTKSLQIDIIVPIGLQTNDVFCNINYRINSVAINPIGKFNFLTWELLKNFRVANYFKVWDPFTCDSSLVATIDQIGLTDYQHLFIDYLGRIYFSAQLNNQEVLYRCRNGLYNPVLMLNYANGFSNRQFNDMVIIQDKIIGLNMWQNAIYVLDTSFNLINTMQPNYQLTALTSLNYGCDSFKIIASGYRMGHTEFLNALNSSDSSLADSLILFDLDPFQSSLKFLGFSDTQLNRDGIHNPVSLTSFGDILNSDPECDLLLDLDRNNSSGLYPYNFQLDRMVCNKDLYPICDTDVYLHTNLALDSMQFRLTGIKDIGLEYLIGTNMPVGFLFIQRSDSLYSLIGNANSPDLSFMNAMRSIYYRHTGITNRTDGERVIHIEGYSPIKKGQTVRCSIQVLKLVKTQQDSFICPGTFIQDQMGNKYFEGDTINELKSQGTADCDTIKQIIVKNYNVRQVTIKGDSILCRNTSKQLCVEPYQSYRWSTGEQGPCININQAGSYQVSVSDEHACSSTAEFNVSYPMVPNYQIDRSHPRCPGERNGELRIQAVTAIKQYQVNGIINTNGNFDKLESGIYQIQLTDLYDCIYLDTAELKEADEIIIYFQDTLKIRDRIAELLKIENNGVELDTIRIEPTQGIERLREWEFLINPDKGGHYKIIVKDKNGCINEYQLIIQLQLNQNINAPNAFSPNQDGINELWNISLG